MFDSCFNYNLSVVDTKNILQHHYKSQRPKSTISQVLIGIHIGKIYRKGNVTSSPSLHMKTMNTHD